MVETIQQQVGAMSNNELWLAWRRRELAVKGIRDRFQVCFKDQPPVAHDSTYETEEAAWAGWESETTLFLANDLSQVAYIICRLPFTTMTKLVDPPPMSGIEIWLDDIMVYSFDLLRGLLEVNLLKVLRDEVRHG